MVENAEATVLLLTEREDPPTFVAELARSERYRPIGRTTSATHAVASADTREADVMVADVVSVERLNEVVDAARTLERTKVVVVSDLPPEVALLPCMAAGVRGFVRVPFEPGMVDRAVSAVLAGHTFVDPESTGWLVELAVYGLRTREHSGLTLRQSQVIELARGGLTNREIARVLGVSSETVKTHLQEAMRRLGAHDRWAATALADRLRDEQP